MDADKKDTVAAKVFVGNFVALSSPQSDEVCDEGLSFGQAGVPRSTQSIADR